MDKMLEKYEKFTTIKSKLVTPQPVYFKVNHNAHTDNSSAHILKYSRPRHFAVVFSGGFYNYHKNDEYMIKNIILHELAHILHPYDHNIGFRKTARLLGAVPRYCKQR
jgi:Zn-dependent protease with chaperone function